MTLQEILEGITRHRANPPNTTPSQVDQDIKRKIDEIEWALQALTEWLLELDIRRDGKPL